MHGDRLGDLVADAVHRVQRGQRILEDHGDPVPAHRLQQLLRLADEILAVELDLAGNRAPSSATGRGSPSTVTDFPDPDSPTIPSVSDVDEIEAHVVDRVHDPVVRSGSRP